MILTGGLADVSPRIYCLSQHVVCIVSSEYFISIVEVKELAEIKERYVHGTAAEKIQYDVYEENKVLKQKRNQRSNNKAKFKMFLIVLFVFILGATISVRYAMITELSYNIDKQTKKYNSIINENSRLRVEIEKSMNLSKIKDVAEGKLGMQKPDKYQIVYVNVPRSDISLVSEKYKDTDKLKGSISAVFDKISELTKLLD